MSRKPRGTRKPKYYDCFLCGEKFNSSTMPCAIVLDHEICWTCKDRHKTFDKLSTVILSKETELSEAKSTGGTT